MYSDEDICVWADGSWCYMEDLESMTWKSDDFRVLRFDTPEWHAVDKE